MAIFAKAQNKKLAQIIKIKPEDRIAFDAFVVQLQRDMIRNKKKGRSSCGCGCSCCPMEETCHTDKI